MAGKVLVISCGPGGQYFITLEALKKIETCQILIGSERLLSTFAPSGKKQIVLTGAMENLELTLKEHETKTVGILVTGDAGLYSLAKKVLTLCEPGSVEIVPGVSSLQVAFARLGQSWDNVETFSFHGRPFDRLDRLCHAQKAAVFCDKVNSAKAILKKLLPFGLNQRYFICQNLTLDNEKVIDVKSYEELQNVDEVSTELLVILTKENE